MNKDEMECQKWVYCPVCGNKTRVSIEKTLCFYIFHYFAQNVKGESD